MRWTEFFIPTVRDLPSDVVAPSHQLMIRAGMIRQVAAGSYTYLPLGYRTLRRIEAIVRDEMDAAGAIEMHMPALQPVELWQQTGRVKSMGDTLIHLPDKSWRKGTVLGPTHEEVITEHMRTFVSSYKQLPLNFYQIQTKFRDEKRPKSGVLRTREFLMKDAYSFDVDIDGLDESYRKMTKAYETIYSRCGLPYLTAEAESGSIGGDDSHEYVVETAAGEDMIVHCLDRGNCGYDASIERVGRDTAEGDPCPKCNGPLALLNCIEIGHIFKLGTKYSDAMGATFLDANGKSHPLVMGCYGIGLNRIMAAAIEFFHDSRGIVWPKAIAPFDVTVLSLDLKDDAVRTTAEQIHDDLVAAGFDVLLDDRDRRPGPKFNDADLIGIPLCITVGKKSMADGVVELKERARTSKSLIAPDEVVGACARSRRAHEAIP